MVFQSLRVHCHIPDVEFVTNVTNGICVKDFWARVKLCETGQTQAKVFTKLLG